MDLFDKFNIPIFHPIFPTTGFSIKFENNEVKLTSLEKYKRISLKIFEEDIEYLKEQLKDSKITMMMLIPPSYLKGKHRRRTIAETLSKHWELHVILKKEIELLTIEEFKKFQRIAVIGVDLNSKHGVAYSIWIWDKSNSLKPMKIRFLKGIKTHKFQEKVLRKFQKNHGNSVNENELYKKDTSKNTKGKTKNILKKFQENLLILL